MTCVFLRLAAETELVRIQNGLYEHDFISTVVKLWVEKRLSIRQIAKPW